MGALVRVAAVALAGSVLYYAGIVNSMVIERPDRLGAVLVVLGVGAAVTVIVVALAWDGRSGERRSAPRRDVFVHRAAWLVVCVMALVGASWLVIAPRQHSNDWTPYHNDAIALNECAARLLLAGRDPYLDLDLFACYGRLGIGADRTTPLRRGVFSEVPVYPSDDELDAAWVARVRDSAANVEFEWRPSYPALSFVLIAPWVRLGWDTNVLYVFCLLAAMTLVLVRTPAGLRPFMLTALFAAASLTAFTVGGSADLLYALPLVAAWLWRERRWSGLVYGIAVATKQLAWFFAPFFLIAVAARQGWRVALRRAAEAAAVFVLANTPFIVADPGSWLAGILAPVADPMFPRGAGLVFLATNGLAPLWPPLLYTALEAIAGGVCLLAAWRTRHSQPELGIVLAPVPLFFAYRSLFSYFFLLPLFAFAGLVRLPLVDVGPAAARLTGALTLFALPARLGPRSRRPVEASPAAAD